MYGFIIPHLHSKAPLPYLLNFVNCFCTKIQHFSSCIPLFVPYSKRNRRFFVLSVQKPPPPPSPEYAKNKTRTIAWSRSYWWARVDSNHRSIKQQIYSLSPLATREHAPILFSSRRRLAGRLVYFTTGFAVCQQLFQTFPVLCARLPVRPAKGGGAIPRGAAGSAGLLAYFSTRRGVCQQGICFLGRDCCLLTKFLIPLVFFQAVLYNNDSGIRRGAAVLVFLSAAVRPNP